MLVMNSRLLAKKLIGEKRLSVEGLAFKSGFSYSHTAQWLSGKSISLDAEKEFRRVLDDVLSEGVKATG